MPSYKLTYFNIRGRAELTRLVFVAAGVAYEDNRIQREKWAEMKPTMPQGQLPILEVDGVILPQSLAIARFVAREVGLCGRNNLEQAQADVVVQTCEDLRSGWVKGFREKDETRKAEIMKEFAEEVVPKMLGILEKILECNNGGNGFYIGDSVTLADLSVYDVLEMIVNKHPGMLEKFPKLKANRQRVAELPKIKAYLASRPVTDF